MALLVDCPIGYAVRSETDGGVQAQGSFYRPSDSSHSRRWMESLSTRKLLHTIGFVASHRWMESLSTRKLLHTIGFVASHRWMEDLCQSTFLQSIRFLDKPKWMESLCQLTSPQWPPQTSFSRPIQFDTSHFSPRNAILNTFVISGTYVTANTPAAAPTAAFLYLSGTCVPAARPMANRQNFTSAKSFHVLSFA